MFGLTALELARIQFGFTVSFHIIFPAITIGLASYLAVLDALHDSGIAVTVCRNEAGAALFRRPVRPGRITRMTDADDGKTAPANASADAPAKAPVKDPRDLPDVSGLVVGVLGGTGELQRRLTALPAETFPNTTRYAAELTSGKDHDRFDFTLDLMIDGLAQR